MPLAYHVGPGRTSVAISNVIWVQSYVVFLVFIFRVHSVTHPAAMDQDDSFPEHLPTRLSEKKLYEIGTFLHRDVVQTLYQFAQQLGKFDAYLKYVCNGTKDHFRPKSFLQEVVNLTYNVVEMRRRLEVCKDHGHMSLTLVGSRWHVSCVATVTR